MSVNKFIVGWEWKANKQCLSSLNAVPQQRHLTFKILGLTHFSHPFLQMVIKSLIVKGRRGGRVKTGKQIFNYGPAKLRYADSAPYLRLITPSPSLRAPVPHGSNCITHSERSSVISSHCTAWPHIITAHEWERDREIKSEGNWKWPERAKTLNTYLRIHSLWHPPKKLLLDEESL